MGDECLDHFLLGQFEEFAEFAAEGFLEGSFESMEISDILRESQRDIEPFWWAESLDIFLRSWAMMSFFSSLSLLLSSKSSSAKTS